MSTMNTPEIAALMQQLLSSLQGQEVSAEIPGSVASLAGKGMGIYGDQLKKMAALQQMMQQGQQTESMAQLKSKLKFKDKINDLRIEKLRLQSEAQRKAAELAAKEARMNAAYQAIEPRQKRLAQMGLKFDDEIVSKALKWADEGGNVHVGRMLDAEVDKVKQGYFTQKRARYAQQAQSKLGLEGAKRTAAMASEDLASALMTGNKAAARSAFTEAKGLGMAEKAAKTAGRMKLGGLGAAALAAIILPKMLGKKEQGVPPEIQLAMMQRMAGGGGGPSNEDGQMSMGRDLLNLNRALSIVKMIQDMQGMQGQAPPEAARLV